MLRFVHATVVPLAFCASPLFAQSTQEDAINALFDATGMPEIIAIMRQEGLDYGTTLAADMIPGGASDDWSATVSRVYDEQSMLDEIRGSFQDRLAEDDIDTMLDFYTSPLGTKIVGLEVAARHAMLDQDVSDASVEAAALARMDETPRFLMAQTYIDENDLIEGNVEGSLNSAYAFYTGIIDGGAMPAQITVETALQDVWAQEPEMRTNATEWIYSFVLMAYQPLSDDELAQLTAFSQTDAGKDLTRAMFGAYNEMFADISRTMGLAVSQFMLTQAL